MKLVVTLSRVDETEMASCSLVVVVVVVGADAI